MNWLTRAICALIVTGLLTPLARGDEKEVYAATVEDVSLKIFIPRDTKVIRGILLHTTNYKMNPEDRWAEFCRARGWAHFVQDLGGKNGGRSQRLPKSADEGIKLFAEQSGHAELVSLPWTAVGHSAGGMGMGIVLRHPDKALTNCISCGWVADPSKRQESEITVPYLCVLGAIPDAFKMLPGVEANFEPARKAGLPWGLALQWGCAHDFGNSACLFIPWIKGVEDFRVDKTWDPAAGQATLKKMTEADGWLGDRSTTDTHFATVAAFADFKGDKSKASWFPNRETAFIWRAIVSKDAPVVLDAAAADGSVALGKADPKAERGMLVNPKLSVTLKATVVGAAEVEQIEFMDGDKSLGVVKSQPWEWVWKEPAQGPHSVFVVWTDKSGKPGTSNPALISIRKYPVATAGAEIARPEDNKAPK